MTANISGVWAEMLGQDEAVAQLQQAVAGRDKGVHHAWLMTGPPGSGRSNLAHAFARALLCPNGGCGTCHSCVLAEAGTHPDISVLATDKIIMYYTDGKMPAENYYEELGVEPGASRDELREALARRATDHDRRSGRGRRRSRSRWCTAGRQPGRRWHGR